MRLLQESEEFCVLWGVTIGTIVIFTEYARQFTRPLNDLANQINTVLSAIAGASEYFQSWMRNEDVDEGNFLKSTKFDGEVEFKEMYFKYELNENQEIH